MTAANIMYDGGGRALSSICPHNLTFVQAIRSVRVVVQGVKKLFKMTCFLGVSFCTTTPADNDCG